jgi:7-cyano-7-deazaguanine synthase in queuosine biosynthesis
MSDTVQLFTVIALVALAVGFVARNAWRKHKGQAPACGNCTECHCDPGDEKA